MISIMISIMVRIIVRIMIRIMISSMVNTLVSIVVSSVSCLTWDSVRDWRGGSLQTGRQCGQEWVARQCWGPTLDSPLEDTDLTTVEAGADDVELYSTDLQGWNRLT